MNILAGNIATVQTAAASFEFPAACLRAADPAIGENLQSSGHAQPVPAQQAGIDTYVFVLIKQYQK